MPNIKDIRMEHMSEAFLKALCAVNGYTMTKPTDDNDGVDQEIKCKGWPTDDHTTYQSPRFDVQLKSSHSGFERKQTGELTYKLRAKNYNDLVATNRATPLILIVLMMYENIDDWTIQTNSYLKITKCAYWINLQGEKPTNNVGTKTIVINEDQLLTANSLKELMIRASKGERL